jgi:hypothetical protein
MAFSVEADAYVATYAIYADDADDARYRDWVHRRTAALAAAPAPGRPEPTRCDVPAQSPTLAPQAAQVPVW